MAQNKKIEGKQKEKIATHTLTSPISYHIITISIRPAINPRFKADSRWFKILSQTQSHVTVPERLKRNVLMGPQ